jgi:hypothetical protein
MEGSMKKKASGGRPPKFSEESGPITVTLPRRIVQKLETIDSDRAKAIVKCVDSTIDTAWPNQKRVEVIEIEKGIGLIVIGPSESLKNIPWLRLIEIAPCRFLLAIPTGTALELLEIVILDLIENLPEDQITEKALLTDLRRKLSHHRRKDGLSKGEILYINTEEVL